LVVVTAVALLLGTGTAVAAVGLSALALRERLVLEPRLEVSRPGLRAAVQIRRFVVLWVATCLVFAYVESYLHWREGLGWHGLRCLTGPVHRDAIPILAAFSLVAVALHVCGEHLVSWIRRTLRRLFPVPRRARTCRRLAPDPAVSPLGRSLPVFRSRGPPATCPVLP
jgi:hypothetical protein